jgi:hypothetical protein
VRITNPPRSTLVDRARDVWHREEEIDPSVRRGRQRLRTTRYLQSGISNQETGIKTFLMPGAWNLMSDTSARLDRIAVGSILW